MGKTNPEHWMLLLNPHAGAGKGKKDLDIILRHLKEAGFNFELFISEYPQHAIPLTIEGIEKGYRKIIIAGGDGTMNEVANGIFKQQVCPPSEIVVGMIPVGTGNDWIKTFEIPNEYEKAISCIKREKILVQDVGQITFNGNGEQSTRFFTNMAGFGFDALVAEKANRLKNKGRTGLMVYLQSLAASYLQYQTRKVNIAIDGEEVEDLIFSASIGIGKYNGGGMMQAPGAIPDNGLFQVTVIRKIGLLGILWNLPGLFTGTFVNDRRVSVYQAKQVSISSSQKIAGEADGELLGNHQFKIDMLPKQLQVIVGRKVLEEESF